MHKYEHTQPGTLMRWVLGGYVLISGGLAVWLAQKQQAGAFVPISITAILAITLLLVHSLTVEVSRKNITLRFGIGLISKRYNVADILSAATVRNRWYYGWGIHLTPHGWLYNVSGFDAVELEFNNGRKVRIGTDEPDELLAAIELVMGKMK